MSEAKVHFQSLDELRAIAALAVIIHHIEWYKYHNHDVSLYQTPLYAYFIDHLGLNGVYLFFVLSGFLITYLLLSEKQLTKKIDIKKFYIRRALRIWPLYFIIMFIGFIAVPFLCQLPFFQGEPTVVQIDQKTYFQNALLFLFFLSNVARYIYPSVFTAAQSWSVSIEEQFYAIWPWLIRSFKKPLLLLLCIACGKPLLLYGMQMVNDLYWNSSSITTTIEILNGIRIELMAMGGLGAHFLINKPVLMKKISNNNFLFFLTVPLSGLMCLFWSNPYLLGMCFTFIILYCIQNPISSKPLQYIGKVSYGFYMYHVLTIFVVFAIIRHINIMFPLKMWQYNFLCYTLVFALTLLISGFSYKYIESPLLKLKGRFQVIQS